MDEHPPSYLLEELAAGAGDEQTARHVRECEACQAYVSRLEKAAAEFAGESPSPEQFAERVATQGRNQRRFIVVPAAAACLVAAAAGLFLLIRPPEPPSGPVARATVTAEPATPEIRFKGKPQLAIIRKREGGQQRLSVEAGVRAWDRLRVEVSVDAPSTVEVGVLSDDGNWLTLMPATPLDPGTHFTPRAVRFDDAPSAGWVIAGSPESVVRARQNRSFEEVTVIPLHVEKEP